MLALGPAGGLGDAFQMRLYQADEGIFYLTVFVAALLGPRLRQMVSFDDIAGGLRIGA